MASRLRAHVMAIASAPHNVQHDEELEAAAQYIERELQNIGYSIGRQEFSVDGSNVRNIEALRDPRGNAPTTTLVVGAHYDSYEDAPGANDNATGTAAVIELARLLKDWQPERTRLRFVLLVNEEPPYYRTPDMGSWRYAERLSEAGEHILGMIALETIGAFSDIPNSQRYPRPFGLIFPSTATSSRLLVCPVRAGSCIPSSVHSVDRWRSRRLAALLPMLCPASVGPTIGLSISSGSRQS